MSFLDIYRREPDKSFSWFASAYSVKMARAIIKSSASTARGEYLICDNATKEKITLSADGCWLDFRHGSEAGTVRSRPGLSSALHVAAK